MSIGMLCFPMRSISTQPSAPNPVANVSPLPKWDAAHPRISSVECPSRSSENLESSLKRFSFCLKMVGPVVILMSSIDCFSIYDIPNSAKYVPITISTLARPARSTRSGTVVAMRAPVSTPGTAPIRTVAASATSTRPAAA